jgi:hypothetical protein
MIIGMLDAHHDESGVEQRYDPRRHQLKDFFLHSVQLYDSLQAGK